MLLRNLTQEIIDSLLDDIGVSNRRMWKGAEKMFCCPIHGESNPSMGINIEKQVCHCFSCGFSGDIVRFTAFSLPDIFHPEISEKRAYVKAKQYLIDKYHLDSGETTDRHVVVSNIKRYHEVAAEKEGEEKKTLPLYTIAPYMSGKETYRYVFDRGFTKRTVKRFMIGRDLDNKTVTLPVFDENSTLVGVIGRYIDTKRKSNERYKIYNGFKRKYFLYPLNISKPKDGTIILVEGQFDAIRMIELGYTNTFATLTNFLSRPQRDWIVKNCEKVIWLGDNDERGKMAREKAKKMLKGIKFNIVDYPDYGKDACEWTDDDIHKMISKASMGISGIRRI